PLTPLLSLPALRSSDLAASSRRSSRTSPPDDPPPSAAGAVYPRPDRPRNRPPLRRRERATGRRGRRPPHLRGNRRCPDGPPRGRSEEHTSELQSREKLV